MGHISHLLSQKLGCGPGGRMVGVLTSFQGDSASVSDLLGLWDPIICTFNKLLGDVVISGLGSTF